MTVAAGALIELERIEKNYPMRGGDVRALRGVTLSFDQGEFAAIIGSSGSGKSTLLYLLGLLTDPTAGTYKLAGRDVGPLSDIERSRVRGTEIGFVFQSFHLVPQLSIVKNVLLAARYAQNGHDGPTLEKRATELVERVGLGHRTGHRPIELSNGEMQRVAIARALLMEPKLILADEPTGNLDEENGTHIFDLMKALNDEGTTIIMVTHDQQLAERTKRVVRLRDGELAS